MSQVTAADSGLRGAVSDAVVMTWRQLLQTVRVPELLFFATIQPIMFVLLFAYVFGGAIPVPGGSYREYLMAGIFTQTVAFTTGATAVGLATDLSKGLVDRFRSLPMARSAVLFGRTLGDSSRNLLVVVVMLSTGLLVGWRIHRGLLLALAGFALILLFGYAMSWVGAYIGLLVRTPETANTAGFVWLFPLTFLSNAFVPLAGLPTWLRHAAEWNPVSATVAAARALFGNPNPLAGPSGAVPFPLAHPVLVSLGWSLLVLAVFVPLAVRRYRAAAN